MIEAAPVLLVSVWMLDSPLSMLTGMVAEEGDLLLAQLRWGITCLDACKEEVLCFILKCRGERLHLCIEFLPQVD
jgi:hypothetical protein